MIDQVRPSAMVKKRLLVLIAMFSGIVMRLIHLTIIQVNLPCQSGGLFAEFSRQIAAHGYALPNRIPFYSAGGIPFAYPPLPFYISAILLDIFPQSKYAVMNILPPLITLLTLPSFYLLTKELDLSFNARLAGMVAYASVPTAFKNQIASSGLAEAFGTLALIWFAISLIRSWRRETILPHILVGLSGAVCLLSSPGSAYFMALVLAASSVIRFAVADGWRGRWRTCGQVLITALVFAMATSPYWLAVLNNHGVSIIVDSFKAEHGDVRILLFSKLMEFGEFRVSGAALPSLWDFAIFCGFLWAIIRRKWALVLTFLVAFSIPREGKWLVSIPACILAGLGFAQILSRFPRLLSKRTWRRSERLIVFAVLCSYLLLNAGFYALDFSHSYDKSMWEASIEAMEWVRDNTPQDAELVVMYDDQVREWVPHVARRTVLNVSQGLEWKPIQLGTIKPFNAYLDVCPNLDCIVVLVEHEFGHRNVYLFLNKYKYTQMQSACNSGNVAFISQWKNPRVVIVTMEAQK